jgi:hypothetical protein
VISDKHSSCDGPHMEAVGTNVLVPPIPRDAPQGYLPRPNVKISTM